MAGGIDRRFVYNVDWVLAGATLALALVGVAMVYSATHSGRHPDLYLKQLSLIGVGTLGLVVAAAVDYRRLADRAVLLYALSVVALLYVLRFAPVIAGTRRWVVIGGFQLQPSELVKLAAAMFVAKVFSEFRQETLGLREVALPGRRGGAPLSPHRPRARPRHGGLPRPALPRGRLPRRPAHARGRWGSPR